MDLAALLTKAGVTFKAEQASSFLQLSRATYIVNEMAGIANLREPGDVLTTYDIVAIRTNNEKVLHSLCMEAAACDIITFDLNEKLLKIKHNVMAEAAGRGLLFEMQFGEALRNDKSRRMILSNMASLVRLSRGKHLILSSGSRGPLQQRSPADLYSL